MQRALTTTELLEAILAELPPLDVLRAQQVCKYWQDVLQTSTTLQRKLFVKADAREIVQHPKTFIKRQPRLVGEGEDDVVPIKILDLNPWLNVFFRNQLQFDDEKRYYIDLPAFQNPGAWTKMYLTSPPMARIDVTIVVFSKRWTWMVSMTDGVGVRLADIVKVVKRETKNAQYAKLAFNKDVEACLQPLSATDLPPLWVLRRSRIA